MKATPSDEELAAIAVALRVRLRVTAQPIASVREPSVWTRNALREGVRAYVPQTWRG